MSHHPSSVGGWHEDTDIKTAVHMQRRVLYSSQGSRDAPRELERPLLVDRLAFVEGGTHQVEGSKVTASWWGKGKLRR
jgi:hypothetical protein